MLDPADEMIVDLTTSCTRQVAAAKLLGWMRGPIYPRYVRVTERGAPVNQEPFLSSIQDSLSLQLTVLLEAERNRVIDAFENDAAAEERDLRLDELLRWEKQINQAATYLRDIDDELAKEDASDLKLNKFVDGEGPGTYITLTSLDRWACKKYGISIFAPSTCQPADLAPRAEPVSADDGDDEEIGGPPGGPLGSVKATNLYAAFAFLVDLYFQAPEAKGKSGAPTYDQVAKCIEEAARAANNGRSLPGVRAQSIRKQISEAMTRKRLKLSGG